ncbi:hypothetical protein [Clostridium sp. SHJSY1]|nr:hypothetical protein [Clostridium sp. SHJSY1]
MAKLRKLIPGIVLIGTRIEMQRLEEILNMNSVTISIRRLENN